MVILAAALAACGGGGDEDEGIDVDLGSTSGPTLSAEGFWDSDAVAMLITGDGQAWGVGVEGSTLTLYHGDATVEGSRLTVGFNAYSDGAHAGTGQAVFGITEHSALDGVVRSGGDESALSLSYTAGYTTPAALDSLAGSWTLWSGGSLTVTADGELSGSEGGCDFSGTIVPDDSGTNVYVLEVQFGAAPCPMPGATASGVLAAASADLLAGGVLNGSQGLALILSR